MKRFGLLSVAGVLCMATALLAEERSRAREQADRSLTVAAQKQTAYPLWDGKETVAQYAQRANLQLWGDPPGRSAIQRIALQETQTLDLGNGVTLELVLIPAGKFIMGTPEPQPVDEAAFHKKIVTGLAVLAAGGGILLVLIGFAIGRAIRERRRFQYSLRRFMAMMLAASLCVLGGMHWWQSKRGLEVALAERRGVVMPLWEALIAELPAHEVTITKPFYIGKYEVTQTEFQQVMGFNPSHSKGSNLPVQTVSWFYAQEFCRKVTMTLSHERERGSVPLADACSSKLRLPTEAEWEYACRAGTTTAYCSGDKDADLARAGWFHNNSGDSTHSVGQKEPNAWGLYDMHGNVWELCEDWFGHYPKEAVVDPQGLKTGEDRVLRGGCCYFISMNCRSATRFHVKPDHTYDWAGVRVVLEGPP